MDSISLEAIQSFSDIMAASKCSVPINAQPLFRASTEDNSIILFALGVISLGDGLLGHIYP